ncbi:MAG: anthranilate phosphoribosyltransferase [Gemmatimonadaceae bacterium]
MSTDATTPLLIAIRRLAAGESLSAAHIAAAFASVMTGDATPAQIAALLVGLRVKGETAGEIAGVAQALRGAMVPLQVDNPSELVDTCGTGGGAVTTFNISTAAALVAAGAGVRIAKHGNRSFTSLSGSADVLEALGVAIEVPVASMARTLSEAGIVFMFAPLMHPAMRHVGPIRRELAIPTVMNIVGPLANPARAGRQVLGVADERRLPLLAGALCELGTTHALVVHGTGLDEVSPLGPTRMVEVRGGQVHEWQLDPREYDVATATPDQLAGGTPRDNASIITAVLRGEANPGATAAVVLNAAAAIYVSGRVESFGDAVLSARNALESGAGLAALERLRAAVPRASLR